jgi:hypothetical protein
MQIPNLISSTVVAAVIASLCACHSREVAQSPPAPTESRARSFSDPVSFIGTVPVSGTDEKVITPMETVGATPD